MGGARVPLTVRLDRPACIVRLVASGELTSAEIRESLDQAIALVGAERGWRVLSDHRLLTAPATTAQIKLTVSDLHEFGQCFHGTRWAVITAGAASFGMIRMLGALAASVPITVRAFTDADEAERWLAADG